MNWEAIGAVGEILGALAVVISLAYLAIQIRTQNQESKIASVHEILAAYRETIVSLQHGETATIYIKAIQDSDSLDAVERVRFIALCQSMFRVWEEAYLQWKRGRLEDGYWNGINTLILDFLATPAAQEAWNIRKHAYTPEFCLWVESQPTGAYKLREETNDA